MSKLIKFLIIFISLFIVFVSEAQNNSKAYNLYNSEGKLFLHFHGAYHSDFHDGIVWYLHNSNPDLKIMTLSTVLQDNTSNLDEENIQRANYIIVVPADMTRTY